MVPLKLRKAYTLRNSWSRIEVAIMENPVLDQEKILLMQRKMLVAKKERMERLNSLRMRWRHSIRNSRIKE